MADFVLRDLPAATWAEFEARAKREGRPRPVLLAGSGHRTAVVAALVEGNSIRATARMTGPTAS